MPVTSSSKAVETDEDGYDYLEQKLGSDPEVRETRL
jgi:hypothetical protein